MAHPPCPHVWSKIWNLPHQAGGLDESAIHLSLGHSMRMDLLPLVHSQGHCPPHPSPKTHPVDGVAMLRTEHWVCRNRPGGEGGRKRERERKKARGKSITLGLNSAVTIIWSLLSLFMFQSRSTREGPS